MCPAELYNSYNLLQTWVNIFGSEQMNMGPNMGPEFLLLEGGNWL